MVYSVSKGTQRGSKGIQRYLIWVAEGSPYEKLRISLGDSGSSPARVCMCAGVGGDTKAFSYVLNGRVEDSILALIGISSLKLAESLIIAALSSPELLLADPKGFSDSTH